MFKVGDVLVSRWGYGMTIIYFYKVVKISKTNCWLQRMEGKIVEAIDEGFSGRVIAGEIKKDSKPFMRKLKAYIDGEDYVKISSYERAIKWDGKPKYFNELD